MKNSLSLKCSSFIWETDLYMPDGYTPPNAAPVTTGWRPYNPTCLLDANGNRTGYAHADMLEQYILATNAATGVTKANVSGDANYIPDYLDATNCTPQNSNLVNFVFTNNTGKAIEVYLTGRNTGTTKKLINTYQGDFNETLPNDKYDMLITGDVLAGAQYKLTYNGTIVYSTDQQSITLSAISLQYPFELIIHNNPDNGVGGDQQV